MLDYYAWIVNDAPRPIIPTNTLLHCDPTYSIYMLILQMSTDCNRVAKLD